MVSCWKGVVAGCEVVEGLGRGVGVFFEKLYAGYSWG